MVGQDADLDALDADGYITSVETEFEDRTPPDAKWRVVKPTGRRVLTIKAGSGDAMRTAVSSVHELLGGV